MSHLTLLHLHAHKTKHTDAAKNMNLLLRLRISSWSRSNLYSHTNRYKNVTGIEQFVKY